MVDQVQQVFFTAQQVADRYSIDLRTWQRFVKEGSAPNGFAGEPAREMVSRVVAAVGGFESSEGSRQMNVRFREATFVLSKLEMLFKTIGAEPFYSREHGEAAKVLWVQHVSFCCLGSSEIALLEKTGRWCWGRARYFSTGHRRYAYQRALFSNFRANA